MALRTFSRTDFEKTEVPHQPNKYLNNQNILRKKGFLPHSHNNIFFVTSERISLHSFW